MLTRALCQVIAGPTVEPHALTVWAMRRKPSCLISCSHISPEGSVSALVASPPGDEAGREGTLQHSEGSQTFALSRNEAWGDSMVSEFGNSTHAASD
jgi:hypothetical protein